MTTMSSLDGEASMDCSSPSSSPSLSPSPSSSLLALRRYQEMIIDQAKDSNTIAFLPTGAGKTLIACYLIGHRVRKVRLLRDSDDWKRVVVFIAPTKALLDQQVRYIMDHCPENVLAMEINGSTSHEGKNIEFWSLEDWKEMFLRYEVLGMTPGAFRSLLEKGIIPAGAIDSVFIDECHHASGSHPMALMCDALHARNVDPLIFGMTASPSHSKKGKIRNDFSQLETRLRAQFFIPSMEVIQSISDHKNHPALCVAEFEENAYADLKTLCLPLRHCINLQRVYLSSKRAGVLESDLYAKLCQTVEVMEEELSFRFIARPLNFETMINQTAEVAGSAGFYCGLLALSACFEEPAQMISPLEVIESRSVDSDVDQKVIDGYLTDLSAAAGGSLAILKGWHDQLQCFLEVFLVLIVEIVFRAFEKDPFLLHSAIANYLQSPSQNVLMNTVLEGILEHPQSPLYYREKLTVCSAQLPDVLPHFCTEMKSFLGIVHGLVSFRPLALALGSSSDMLRRALGENLLSNKVLCLLEYLYAYFGCETEIPFLSMQDLCIVDRLACFQQTPSNSTKPYSIDALHEAWQQQQLSKSAGNKACSSGDKSAIIFCSTRILVKVLLAVIERVSESWMKVYNSTFPVQAVCLTGQCTSKSQKEALRALKTGDANLLFATQVVEEGLDVKSCNLIINYDSPPTVKSFIQRKGRARAGYSFIIQLAPKPYGSQRAFEDLIKFIKQESDAEKALVDWLCVTNNMFETTKVESDRFIVPNTQASIDGVSAMGLIHEYCQCLEQNTMDVQSALYVYEREDSQFRCTITLPKKANIPAIVSDPRPKKIAAKGHAAVLAVAELHRMGKLDDHLRIPISAKPYGANPIGSVKKEDNRATTYGVPDVMNVQIKSVPDKLIPCPAFDGNLYTVFMYYFHVEINMKRETLHWKTRKQIQAIESVGFAFAQPLSSGMMDQASQIFFRNMDNDVQALLRICEYRSCRQQLSREELAAMQHFHQCVFSLQIKEMMEPDRTKDFLRCVGEVKIDFSVCDSEEWAKSGGGAWYTVFPVQTNDSSLSFMDHLAAAAVEAHFLVHNLCVVGNNNARQLKSVDFFPVAHQSVQDIMEKDDLLFSSSGCNLLLWSKKHNQNTSDLLKLTDQLPNLDVTYFEHFSKRNDLFKELIDRLVVDESYRLTRVYQVSGKLTFYDLLKVDKLKERSSPFNVVLEGCQFLGSASLYYMSLVLPSITHRIKSLLLAEETIGWVESVISARLETVIPRFMNDMTLMLKAITPKLAFEHQHSELLEFYGDSVLKYITSVTLFCQSSSSDEELLTNQRGAIVSNAFLTHLCQRSGLSQYLRGSPLSRGLEEVITLPAGFNMNALSLRNCNVQLNFPVALLSDEIKSKCGPFMEVSVGAKSLADLLEAVLGAIYVATNRSDEVVSLFLENMGIIKANISRSKENFYKVVLQSYRCVHRLSAGEMSELSILFNHQFLYPQLLVAALTHKSYPGDLNYERLEFLGDAVLDMTIVEYLFNSNVEDEGQMSQEKSNRANNHRLAKVALKMNLPKYVYHENLPLQMGLASVLDMNLDGGENNNLIDDFPVLKVLADIMEAILGAIYLDCGFDLNYMMKIVEHLGLFNC